MNLTPLEVIVGRAHLLLDVLYEQSNRERALARWPRATQPGPITTGHNPSDKTAQTAITPDPINQARADRIEGILRRITRELEDETARTRKRQPTPCDTDGCTRPARRKGLCDKHYMRAYRMGQRRSDITNRTFG